MSIHLCRYGHAVLRRRACNDLRSVVRIVEMSILDVMADTVVIEPGSRRSITRILRSEVHCSSHLPAVRRKDLFTKLVGPTIEKRKLLAEPGRATCVLESVRQVEGPGRVACAMPLKPWISVGNMKLLRAAEDLRVAYSATQSLRPRGLGAPRHRIPVPRSMGSACPCAQRCCHLRRCS